MPENRQNHKNVAPISSDLPLNDIKEGIQKMKIERKEEGEEYPSRPGEADCIYYLRTGTCGYASNCRFNHPPLQPQSDQSKNELPQRDGQPDCGHFLKTGTCKYGSMCKYHHPLDRRGAEDVPLNSLGLPLREQEKPCSFYLRTQKCKYGAACKFDHPQPPSVESALPVPPGAVAVGIGSSLPSTGIPYVGAGALPAWPWARSSRVPGPQAYMPYFIPPLQGPVAAQNWNSYLGNMSSMAAPGVVGTTDLIYNPINSGEMISGGQVDLSAINLPERPDQPECRFFMSTGACKYGANCKFHHPKARIAHSLGPHGLPLRPGEDVCGHFTSYGICKYGPTCKYNHPIAGYISSYYYGMPSIPYLNQPFIATQKNSAVLNSAETSHQSKSSKITDWIQKPEIVDGKNRQHSATKPDQVTLEKNDDQPVSVSVATDEIPRDQSD